MSVLDDKLIDLKTVAGVRGLKKGVNATVDSDGFTLLDQVVSLAAGGVVSISSGGVAGVPAGDVLTVQDPHPVNTFKPQNAVAIAAEVAIWTPVAGKKFRLRGYHLSASVAGNIILRDGLAGAVVAVIPSSAGGEGVYVDLRDGKLSATANNALTAQGPAASTLSGLVFGDEE